MWGGLLTFAGVRETCEPGTLEVGCDLTWCEFQREGPPDPFLQSPGRDGDSPRLVPLGHYSGPRSTHRPRAGGERDLGFGGLGDWRDIFAAKSLRVPSPPRDDRIPAQPSATPPSFPLTHPCCAGSHSPGAPIRCRHSPSPGFSHTPPALTPPRCGGRPSTARFLGPPVLLPSPGIHSCPPSLSPSALPAPGIEIP